MSNRLERMVMPWRKVGYRGNSLRKRELLCEVPHDRYTYFQCSVYKYTGNSRWNYSVQYRVSGGIDTNTSMITSPLARIRGYTMSEGKSMAIVDEYLSKVLELELITIDQMKKYQVMK